MLRSQLGDVYSTVVFPFAEEDLPTVGLKASAEKKTHYVEVIPHMTKLYPT